MMLTNALTMAALLSILTLMSTVAKNTPQHSADPCTILPTQHPDCNVH